MPDPAAWVERLNAQLDERNKRLKILNDYYEGEHPLPRAPERAKGAFRRWLRLSRSNWMGLVIDAVNERMAVQGIRYGTDQAADEDAWALWQANGLDVGSEMVHLEAFINGESYVLVGPDPDGGPAPLMLPEHPTQMIVARDPARPGRRLAAFKKWLDDSGYLFATLYLPNAVHKYRSEKTLKETSDPTKVRWVARIGDDGDILDNPLGVVPVVPFRNRARLLGPGVSEIDGVTDSQDRINETLFQRVMAGQYSAFRQRFATGLDLDIDEETGLPKKPFEPGTSELWVASNPDARFGDFDESSLSGYLESVAADVQHIAAQTHTPPHYLLGEMVNLAAEALKAAEAGLISKVRRRMVHFGESWEEVFRLAFMIVGDERRATVTDAEMIWRNPEFRTEGQLVDALTKMATLGVPREVLWERWGASPQEIARWKTMQVQEALFSGDEPPVPAPV